MNAAVQNLFKPRKTFVVFALTLAIMALFPIILHYYKSLNWMGGPFLIFYFAFFAPLEWFKLHYPGTLGSSGPVFLIGVTISVLLFFLLALTVCALQREFPPMNRWIFSILALIVPYFLVFLLSASSMLVNGV